MIQRELSLNIVFYSGRQLLLAVFNFVLEAEYFATGTSATSVHLQNGMQS